MGKVTGFLDYPRATHTERPVGERLNDYKEIARSLPDGLVSQQAARCMDCGIPFCHAMGCPLFNLIPEWNDLVCKGRWQEAYERLEKTNNLPEITGRICPAPCETACTLSINNGAVSIKDIELAIIEHAFSQGWVTARPPRAESGKKVAVIGSGPAGISAAQQLRRMGHAVTVFEKEDKIGGILRYGIPDFKLEKWVLDRRLEQVIEEGVNFETSVNIGDDLSARYLMRAFDAVLVAMGAGEPRDLQVPGRGLEGIHFAMEYLSLSNKSVSGTIAGVKMISAKNKNALVIGGGDTGSDCVGTANRQGAKKVLQFEIMPRPREWGEPRNPEWPYWPYILRTSTSHEEGCERQWGIITKQFNGRGVSVERIQCARVEWKPSQNGRPPAIAEIPGSEFSLDIDLVLLAMGFIHVEHNKLLEDFNVAFDDRGNVKTNNYATSVRSVFAAGDADTGSSLVVRAIYHGREAAKSIDAFLG
jgi:glutamate synthase (NADPH/NADH) small chain